MEPMIRIQLLVGPQAGYQVTLTDPVITFGRAAETHLTVDDAHLSRHHGDLQFVDGNWHVVCHSANGCKVNGKKLAEGQSRALNPGDVVSVGKMKLFAVNFTPVAPVEGQEEAAAVVEDKPRMSGKAKLWISIGVYLGIMLVVFVVLAAVGKPKKNSVDAAPQLTGTQIAREIKQPIKRPEDERQAVIHLKEAQTWYPRIESRPDGLFNAHYNYKLALAFSKDDTFEGIDQLHFNEVEQKLIKQVTTLYTNAYSLMRGHEWLRAEQAFKELKAVYPNPSPDSKIYDNVTDQLMIIEPHTRRRGIR